MSFYQNKKVLVTGAAHGLGKAMAIKIAEAGARVYLLDIDLNGLSEIYQELKKRGFDSKMLQVDIRENKQIISAAETIEKNEEWLDILINNAAISHHGYLEYSKMEDFEKVILTNLVGTAAMCKAFIPIIKKGPKGIIANISSGIAFMGLPSFGAYAASKAGIRSLSESLRNELSSDGIQVSCIYPGPIKTEISKRAIHISETSRLKEEKYLSEKGYDPDFFAQLILKKLKTGKSDIILGKEVWWGRQMTRFFPGFTAYLFRKFKDKLPV